jgi:DNA mismatch repair protein MutS
LSSAKSFRVVTPGTVVDASMLEEGRSNYICAVYLDHEGGAAAFADVSTGEVCAAGFSRRGRLFASCQ